MLRAPQNSQKFEPPDVGCYQKSWLSEADVSPHELPLSEEDENWPTGVAQNCILLYRGFPIRKVRDIRERSELATLCRIQLIQFGDTAD